MRSSSLVFPVLLGAVFGVLTASLSKALRYQAPDECKWMAVTSAGEEEVSSATEPDQEVALICHLRTINSELENTNFSVIQSQYTVRLRIICADMLYFHSALTPGSLQTLTDLKDLSIEYCKVANLTSGAFRGLRQLRNLTLRTHNVDWSPVSLEIFNGVFTDELGLLERLDLSINSIWHLPDGVFCPLHSLQFLNLTRNRLRDIANLRYGSSTNERCGANLRMLDLSNNSIDILGAGVLSKLSRLQELYLESNMISFIADHALDGLTSLTYLNLADNKLVNLPPEIFSDTRELKELHLQNNSINVLAPGLFYGLTNLLVLDLSENELTDEWINGATFSGLLRLVILSISGNNILRLEASVFRDLYSLQILRLEDNAIESISDNTFTSLNNLHTLSLSNNKLTRIDSNTLSGLYGLSVLSLDSNKIQYIDPEALRNSSNLQELHLNSNKLYDIPAVLSDVQHLKTLDLGDNLITEILNISFVNMRELVGLRLIENNLTNITKGVFDKMKSLRILNLSSNKLQKVEAGTFDENKNLLAIRLDGNYLTEINGLFGKLPNLVWLNISENLLQWFDYAQIPTGLQWLDIHSNQITELGNYFEIESQLHLTTFDASNNKLTEITGNAIPDSVEILNLSNNHITKVQSYTFFKKPNLTKVELVGNQIKILTQNSLRISTIPAGKPLPEFYIGGNPFQCDCTMQWLQQYPGEQQQQERNKPRLMDLDSVVCKLLYNRVSTFVLLKEASSDQFLCQYESNCFPFCHCCDFDACDCEMTCPTNCTCYHDLSWTANVVDCSTSGYVNNLPDRIPMDSTQLYLDGNDIRTVGSHSFIGRKKLQVLFLNSSNVEIIHNRTFNGLKDLELLRLDDNKLEELHGFEFEGLERLRELYLQNNRITAIHNATFVSLVELRVLNLDHNRLVKYSVWQLSSQLTHITLGVNPWSCDCEYTERFKEYLLYSGSAIIDVMSIRCYNGSEYEPGYSILKDNISCVQESISNFIEPPVNGNYTSTTIIQRQELQDYIPLLVATLAIFFTIIVLSCLLFMYRQEMRVWFHSKFGVRLFYRTTEIEMDDRDKLFDAFVSYSAKDEAFVAEELAPMLENGDPSYKLCLHYREFPVGGFLADTIVQAVESSRRTIMVLSENFIKSEWCRFEFKSAHHQVLRDRRKRLIVIVLGEVPQKDLDPDIRLYLKTNTYLQWGDKLFWEKLKFALPDVPNNQRPKSNHLQARHNHSMHHHHVHRNHNNARSVAIHI